jgi:hypothetical protein
MISTLKVRTSGTESLIEKIKAEIKKRAEAKANGCSLGDPKGWRNVDGFSQSTRRSLVSLNNVLSNRHSSR